MHVIETGQRYGILISPRLTRLTTKTLLRQIQVDSIIQLIIGFTTGFRFQNIRLHNTLVPSVKSRWAHSTGLSGNRVSSFTSPSNSTKSHPSVLSELAQQLPLDPKYTTAGAYENHRILQGSGQNEDDVSSTHTGERTGTMEKNLSYLDIMKEADAFPYEDKDPAAYRSLTMTLYKLVWKDNSGPVLGYMLASTVGKLLAVPESLRGPVVIDEAAQTVRAFEHATEAERTAAVEAVMRHWRDTGAFAVLRGWRDEKWPVYGGDAEVVYSAERSGTGMLGVMRYGVHMTGYVRDAAAPHGMRIWVPRRAPTKSTYPGMLDNTVAGGLMTGEDPFECIVREADEEASLPEAVMRERARFIGMVTYIYITDERAGGEEGQIYPETQWVYDIELPAGERPTPKDGEVAEFYLWTVDEVRAELARGSYKPNCALILVDFFIRHGIITPDNEPDYAEILQRLHRRLPFPGPHQVYAASLDAAGAAPIGIAAPPAS
ncbi:NUDIX hydrolase domain-like protein [Hypoxylon argillaceum]|nr:NUDIX hydrolase domain-like protein [Hypoxylon argillaceum]